MATFPELDLQLLPDDLNPEGQLPFLSTVVPLDCAKAAGTEKLEIANAAEVRMSILRINLSFE